MKKEERQLERIERLLRWVVTYLIEREKTRSGGNLFREKIERPDISDIIKEKS